MPGAMTRLCAGFFGVLLLSLGVACDDPAPDLAEWTVEDHTHQSERKQRRQTAISKPATYTQPSKRNTLVEVTWVKQCANCHGTRGKGDGPQSPMVKAKDLTVDAWQSSVTDQQLLEVITKGKGKMPAFNFPESMLTGLVAHIRDLPNRGKGRAARAAAAAAGGAAGSSGAPAAAAGAEEEDEPSEAGEAAAAAPGH
jgi:Cytochrome C oxidase, cbb3-type, subunit III